MAYLTPFHTIFFYEMVHFKIEDESKDIDESLY